MKTYTVADSTKNKINDIVAYLTSVLALHEGDEIGTLSSYDYNRALKAYEDACELQTLAKRKAVDGYTIKRMKNFTEKFAAILATPIASRCYC